MEKMLAKYGRKIIGWDEILEGGLSPEATVMSWRGTSGGISAALQKHDVIMTPGSGGLYLDHYQATTRLSQLLFLVLLLISLEHITMSCA